MTEAESIEVKAALDAVKKDMSDFLFTVSHDLIQHVRGMTTYAKFTLEDFEDQLEGEAVENLQEIIKLGKRFNIWTDALLELSRLTNPELRPMEIDLKTVIDTVLEAEGEKMKSVKVECVNVSVKVTSDAVLLKRVLQKIVQNAMLYNNGDDKNIVIEVKDKADDRILISVADDGIGISERHLEKAFDLFCRLNKKNMYGEHAGAGLTICKKIMELLKGKIYLDITQEKGTKVVLEIPRELVV